MTRVTLPVATLRSQRLCCPVVIGHAQHATFRRERSAAPAIVARIRDARNRESSGRVPGQRDAAGNRSRKPLQPSTIRMTTTEATAPILCCFKTVTTAELLLVCATLCSEAGMHCC